MPPPVFPPPKRPSPGPPQYQARSRSFPPLDVTLTQGAGCRSHPPSRFAHPNPFQCLSSDLPEFQNPYEFPPDTYPAYMLLQSIIIPFLYLQYNIDNILVFNPSESYFVPHPSLFNLVTLIAIFVIASHCMVLVALVSTTFN